jgi:hypothetical protein
MTIILRRARVTYLKISLAPVLIGIACLLLSGADDNAACYSEFRIIPKGDGENRDLALIDWRTTTGEYAGTVRVPFSGIGNIGPDLVFLNRATPPNKFEWDTREWQWWKSFPFPLGSKRLRNISPAEGGAEYIPGGIRVWTRFALDGTETVQEWFFRDLNGSQRGVYDCLITIRNISARPLEEYGQFFASYVSWNESRGHFYWSENGTLVNFADRGAGHLDYYVTARESRYAKLGHIPHCPRGGGVIKAFWRHPVSVSAASPDDYRHILMVEEKPAVALAMGQGGAAQDYILSPSEWTLEPGKSFSAHVRHVIVASKAQDLVRLLESEWSEFVRSHEKVRSDSRAHSPNR